MRSQRARNRDGARIGKRKKHQIRRRKGEDDDEDERHRRERGRHGRHGRRHGVCLGDVQTNAVYLHTTRKPRGYWMGRGQADNRRGRLFDAVCIALGSLGDTGWGWRGGQADNRRLIENSVRASGGGANSNWGQGWGSKFQFRSGRGLREGEGGGWQNDQGE